MLKAIIFDLDGVLIDSEQLMRCAFEDSYRRIFGRCCESALIESYLEHMGESLPQIMKRLDMPPEMATLYHEFCRQHIELITLFPGSRDILEWATAEGLKLGLLTGKDRVRTLQILQHFDLHHFFRSIVTSDQLQRPKPDPEGILRTLELLSSSCHEAVMIGDAVSDIVCAQTAHVRAIAVTWGIKPERVQTLCKPDYVVHSQRALLLALKELIHSIEGIDVNTSGLIETSSDR